MTEQAETDANRDALIADGYSYALANALAEQGQTVESVKLLSKREVLDDFLKWEGIIGYTDTILSVLEDAERNCHY